MDCGDTAMTCHGVDPGRSAGPFGISPGDPLPEGAEPVNKYGHHFSIDVPFRHPAFVHYYASWHEEFGICGIGALSRVVDIERNKTELRNLFNEINSQIASRYGEPHWKTPKSNPQERLSSGWSKYRNPDIEQMRLSTRATHGNADVLRLSVQFGGPVVDCDVAIRKSMMAKIEPRKAAL